MPLSNSDLFMLESDLKEFSLEKDVKTTVKTQEEIDRATVDERLNDIDRAALILGSGQEIQFISVVQNFPFLLKQFQNDCVQKVVPKLNNLLKSAGIDVQLAAAEAFTSIAKEHTISPTAYSQHFLSTIIANINLKDPVSAEAWLECMISAIAHLSKETVQKDILNIAISRGHLSKSTASRLSSCALLGAVAQKFDSAKVKKDILPVLKQLCQDIDFNVRACMCKHLDSVANAMGVEETKAVILPEALELAVDEESQVRGEALQCLMRMRNLLDAGTQKTSLVPLICQYCESAAVKQGPSLLDVAENFGQFCHNFSDCYSPEKQLSLLNVFRQLCKLGRARTPKLPGQVDDAVMTSANALLGEVLAAPMAITSDEEARFATCRRHCAFNFPSIVLFCGRARFKNELLSAYSLLCADPDLTVRRHIASGLHEIVAILQADAGLIQPHVIRLLRETESPVVLQHLFQTLPQTLSAVLVNHNGDSKVNGSSAPELCNILISSVTNLEHQWPCLWRAVEHFAAHIGTFPDFFPPEQIYHKFVPLTFKFLTSNQYLPVRIAASSSVCLLILRSRRHDHRKEICDRLMAELGQSRCYRNRLLFFDVCRNIMKHFSRAFFKEHFCGHVLLLIKDPVPNVRLCVWKILPSVKKQLILPRDRTLHGQLEASVRKLLASEADRDVVQALHKAILELDLIKVKMESITAPSATDTVDHKREEDEKLMDEPDAKVDESGKPSGKNTFQRRSFSMQSTTAASAKDKNAKDLAKSFGQLSTQSGPDAKLDDSPKKGTSSALHRKSTDSSDFSIKSLPAKSGFSNDASFLPASTQSVGKDRKSPAKRPGQLTANDRIGSNTSAKSDKKATSPSASRKSSGSNQGATAATQKKKK